MVFEMIWLKNELLSYHALFCSIEIIMYIFFFHDFVYTFLYVLYIAELLSLCFIHKS